MRVWMSVLQLDCRLERLCVKSLMSLYLILTPDCSIGSLNPMSADVTAGYIEECFVFLGGGESKLKICFHFKAYFYSFFSLLLFFSLQEMMQLLITLVSHRHIWKLIMAY